LVLKRKLQHSLFLPALDELGIVGVEAELPSENTLKSQSVHGKNRK
jgi:hypothetical protein